MDAQRAAGQRKRCAEQDAAGERLEQRKQPNGEGFRTMPQLLLTSFCDYMVEAAMYDSCILGGSRIVSRPQRYPYISASITQCRRPLSLQAFSTVHLSSSLNIGAGVEICLCLMS